MNRIVIEHRVNDEGILQLILPLGAEEAGREVRVKIEFVGPSQKITPEDWHAGILATAGRWQGEFERPPQGELEERERLS